MSNPCARMRERRSYPIETDHELVFSGFGRSDPGQALKEGPVRPGHQSPPLSCLSGPEAMTRRHAGCESKGLGKPLT